MNSRKANAGREASEARGNKAMARKKPKYGYTIYFDTSAKSKRYNHRHHEWRAEIWMDGKRIRKRSKDYNVLVNWLEYMQGHVSEEWLNKVKGQVKDDLAPTEFSSHSRSLAQAQREANDNHNRQIRHSRQFRMHDCNLKKG